MIPDIFHEQNKMKKSSNQKSTSKKTMFACFDVDYDYDYDYDYGYENDSYFDVDISDDTYKGDGNTDQWNDSWDWDWPYNEPIDPNDPYYEYNYEDRIEFGHGRDWGHPNNDQNNPYEVGQDDHTIINDPTRSPGGGGSG